uniref:Uncharacterized protein n=1 Tax=viral metagenome TaxID=1070528 RepID=A0A6M3XUZ3_9ZZZZ
MSRSMVSKEVLMSAEEVAINDTHYSESRRFHDCDGTACLKIISTAGSITVTQQCSTDKVTWYDPETASGAAGAVEDAITVTTGRYLSFTPVLCDYIRFKVVQGAGATTNVTLELAYRVEV